MGIPYQSVLDEDERNVSGAFFRAQAVDRDSYVGGLLVIDARGEPVEFTYNRVSVKHRFLWRERDLRSAVTRELLTALFEACPRVPTALFCLAREVEPTLFLDDVDVQRPVARVAGEQETIGLARDEVEERVDGPTSVQLFWVRGRPSDATDAHRLVQRLAGRGLLLEPFERVLAGLRETYELGDVTGDRGDDGA
jgi:hypothetical protein